MLPATYDPSRPHGHARQAQLGRAIDQANPISRLEEGRDQVAAACGIEECEQARAIGAIQDAIIVVGDDRVEPRRQVVIAGVTLKGTPVGLGHAVNIRHRGRESLPASLADTRGLTAYCSLAPPPVATPLPAGRQRTGRPLVTACVSA